MTGFLDIASRKKSLTISGQAVSVAALSLGDIADLALRFKPFRDLITRSPAFSMVELMNLGRPVTGALIAASIGQLGVAEYEAKAAGLAAGEQGVLLLTLYEVSFPEDVRGPFVDLLARLFNINLNLAADPPPNSSSAATPTPPASKADAAS